MTSTDSQPDSLRQAVMDSGLFDAGFYRATYRGLLAPGEEPLDHFLAKGLEQGYLPSANFDPLIHRLGHPDCGTANPLVHAAAAGLVGQPQPEILALFPELPEQSRRFGHPGPDFDIAEEAALNRAYARRAAEPRQIRFEADGQTYALTVPAPQEILGRLHRDEPFAVVRIPEGFWDALYRIDACAALLAADPRAAVLTAAERRMLAVRICRALYPRVGLYLEAYIEEVTADIRANRDQARFLRATALKGYPTWDEKPFFVRRLLPRHQAQLSIIARHFRPDETLIDATLWKRWAIAGTARLLPAACRPHPVVLVATDPFAELDKRWGLRHFIHVPIAPELSHSVRWELLDRCRAALTEATRLAPPHPVMLTRCGGSVAHWLVTRLFPEFPDVFYLDLGQALNIWFLDMPGIDRHPWMKVYERTVVTHCGLAKDSPALHEGIPMDSPLQEDTVSALIVLGMHRSGTSALTGVLAALGADAGPDLQGGNEFNPRGYWEHRDVVRIHDELLAKLGSAWNDTRPLPADWRQGEPAATAREALLAVLRRDFGASRLWLVKDPRMCRLLPLWLDVLATLGVSPRFVIAGRHPAAVAASLAARDGMPGARAQLLWLQHMIEAERLTRGHRRIAVAYEDLLDNWQAAVARIANTLEVPLTLDDPAAADTVADFLSPTLRHHGAAQGNGGAPTALSELAASVFAALSTEQTSESLAIALDPPGRLVGLLAEVAGGVEPAATAATALPADLAPQVQAIDAELQQLAASQPGAQAAPAVAAPLPPLPPQEEQQIYQQAHSHLAAGDRQQALELLESLARRQSIRWEIYNDLGSLLLEAGRTGEAIAALRNAASLELTSTDSLQNLAAAYVAAGDLGQLLVVCHQLLKQAPDDQNIILFLRDVVLSSDMRFDDYGWLSPVVAALPGQVDELRRRGDSLEAENRVLRAKSRLFDQIAQQVRDEAAARQAAALAAQGPSFEDVRLLFVHIPKTAGISFFSALEEIFGTDRCVRFMKGGKADLPAYRAIPDRSLRNLSVLGGHLSLPQFDERDIRERRVIAVFRDPVDRVLSEYSYIRSWDEHPLHKTIGAMSLEQYVDYLAEDVKRANSQCWYVCGKGDFNSARQMIDKRFFLVAPLERLPEFCTELCWRLGLPAIALPEKNRTEQRLQIDQVEPRLVERLRQIAKDDQALFEYVQERFEQAVRQGTAERQAAAPDTPSRSAGLNGWHKINALSDEAWLEALIKSVELPAFQGFPLPTFPPERMQVGIMGSSNEAGLREGYRYYKLVKALCASHGNRLAADTRLLDFGTGWGRYPRIFLKDIRPENIVGIDVDQSLVDLCRNSFPYCRFEAVPPFPPTELPVDHFDLITAYSVFSHLSEPAATAWIKEFARILAPGGMIAITTQGRSFLDFCENIRRTGGDSERPWHKKLAASFVDAAGCLAAYDRGDFLFEATGGGDVRPSTFYGEALIPEGFVTRHWSQYLEPLAFIDDRGQLPQALIVMRKRPGQS